MPSVRVPYARTHPLSLLPRTPPPPSTAAERAWAGEGRVRRAPHARRSLARGAARRRAPRPAPPPRAAAPPRRWAPGGPAGAERCEQP